MWEKSGVFGANNVGRSRKESIMREKRKHEEQFSPINTLRIILAGARCPVDPFITRKERYFCLVLCGAVLVALPWGAGWVYVQIIGQTESPMGDLTFLRAMALGMSAMTWIYFTISVERGIYIKKTRWSSGDQK